MELYISAVLFDTPIEVAKIFSVRKSRHMLNLDEPDISVAMSLREEGEREDRCRQSRELLKVETSGNESGICTHMQKLSLYIGSNRSLGLKALWFKL